IGGLSGGLIAALTIVILLSNNIISIGDSPAEETNQSDSSSSDTEQVISTNVSDEDNIDISVDEATKAVVGVSRLQEQIYGNQIRKQEQAPVLFTKMKMIKPMLLQITMLSLEQKMYK